MEDTNEMVLEFDSRSQNEGFVRVAVAAFATQLNPTLEEPQRTIPHSRKTDQMAHARHLIQQ